MAKTNTEKMNDRKLKQLDKWLIRHTKWQEAKWYQPAFWDWEMWSFRYPFLKKIHA